MASTEVVCCKYLLTLFKSINLSTEANSVDPDQTGSTPLEQESSKTFRQTTKADNICCDWHFVSDLDELFFSPRRVGRMMMRQQLDTKITNKSHCFKG